VSVGLDDPVTAVREARSWLMWSIFLGGLSECLAKPPVIDEQREDGNRQDNRRRIFSRNSRKRARQSGAQKRS